MNTCPYCGVVTQPEDNFCRNCGYRLHPATPLASQSARLIICGESGEDELSYPLAKPKVSIGRAASSDLILTKDKLASLHHATLSYENGRYVLRDENSANGTFVNGEQIGTATPYALQDGHQIGIGEHVFIFRLSQ
jgi:pSer/pThr/pTyr-binding forkhead associated (FHA) protein